MSAQWSPVAGISGAWTALYDFGGNAITMLAIDLGGGKLAVISPGTKVDDATFSALDALGTVTALVSPGAFHNMGLPAWHQRYPEARLFATASGIAHIAKQHPSLPKLEGLAALGALGGDELMLYETPGRKHGDLLLFLQRDGKTVLFSNELLCNFETLPGNFLIRTAFRLFKAGPGLALNGLAAKLLGANKRDVAAFIRDKVGEHGVDVFVPCHGVILAGPDTADAIGGVLAAAAG